MFGQRQINSMK